MKREDIIKIFDNEECEQGVMFRNDPESKIDVWETTNLLEIRVVMKGFHVLNLFFGNKLEYIDISSNHYLGLGSVTISPISDIEEIDVKWR